jgi:hypothetical protein
VQIAEFVADFRPSAEIRDEILRRLASGEHGDDQETKRRRGQLTERRKRLRDLFELGDLEKGGYVSKRDAIDAELDALSPGAAPDLDGARAVLKDFGWFWEDARDPEARRELVQQLFELVWIDGHKIVAVRPHHVAELADAALRWAERPDSRPSKTSESTLLDLASSRR